jgi:hypothetical protein
MLLALIMSGCAAQPAPQPTPTVGAPFILTAVENPHAPKPEDISRQTGGVVLTSMNLSERTNVTPPRVELNILGLLPRLCNELRVEVADPNDEFQIMVNVYSLVDSNIKCENVFQQFETSILLGVYSPGRYTVLVNDEMVGDFVSNP